VNAHYSLVRNSDVKLRTLNNLLLIGRDVWLIRRSELERFSLKFAIIEILNCRGYRVLAGRPEGKRSQGG
jgi:hypothetical protein